jgi:hypothetical protein
LHIGGHFLEWPGCRVGVHGGHDPFTVTQPANALRQPNAVALEPGQTLAPAHFRRSFVVLRPVVGQEAVIGARKDDDLGLVVGGLDRGAHRFDLRQRDALIEFAVEPQHAPFQQRRHFNGMLRLRVAFLPHHLSIPSDTRLHARIVRRVKPRLPAAPAESGDTKLRRIAAVACRPFHRRIEIGQHDIVVDLHHDLAHELLNVGIGKRIALARIERRRDRKVAFLRKAPADVLIPPCTPKISG